jgi:hypothetical protein
MKTYTIGAIRKNGSFIPSAEYSNIYQAKSAMQDMIKLDKPKLASIVIYEHDGNDCAEVYGWAN